MYYLSFCANQEKKDKKFEGDQSVQNVWISVSNLIAFLKQKCLKLAHSGLAGCTFPLLKLTHVRVRRERQQIVRILAFKTNFGAFF